MGITFCFGGWVRGATIQSVYDVKSKTNIGVPADMPIGDIVKRLKDGTWLISLANFLSEGNYTDGEIEIFDFEVSD